LPLPLPGIGVVLGHRHERADIDKFGWVCFKMDFVKEVFDRTITPLIDRLGEQELHVPTAKIGQLRRQGVDRDTLN
jgi:hypothetical protein